MSMSQRSFAASAQRRPYDSTPFLSHARSETGATPLHHAAGDGRTATVTALLAAGADRNAKDIFGRTPLQRAAEGGHTRAAALLE